MNPSLHWAQLVKRVMSEKRCNYSGAWRLAAAAHPDAATLMSAFGRTRQQASFFNSRGNHQTTPQKAEAGKKLAKFANEKVKPGMPYGQAWNAACRDNPEWAAAFDGGTPQARPGWDQTARGHIAQVGRAGARSQFANATAGTAPAATSEIKKLFWLPDHATQDQFEAAFKGNNSALSPLSPGKIFAALVELTQTQRGIDYDAAIAQTKAAFPDLWKAVQLLAQEPI
ncbi:MAG: hypothetical protein P4N60_18505 [Verrucomicrobiae bacterium]|nr:hypothetical protein [Verrucomicrobiae bacterium]